MSESMFLKKRDYKKSNYQELFFIKIYFVKKMKNTLTLESTPMVF